MDHMLTEDEYAHVVRHAPLVAIDLIIRDRDSRILVGLRNNEPTKGTYFVPGGRIRKNRLHHAAFARISKTETNCEMRLELATFLGVFDHIYDTNTFNESGYETHRVTLGYEIFINDASELHLDKQHAQYRRMTDNELLASSDFTPTQKHILNRCSAMGSNLQQRH